MGEEVKSGVGESLESRLENLLNSMRDWERRPVVQVGRAIVEIVKLPKRETSKRVEPERLALHIRFVDSFRGIFISEENEFRDVVEVLSSKVVQDIVKAIDSVNRRRKVVEYKI